jgi:Ni/Co efflux regulator RcnB
MKRLVVTLAAGAFGSLLALPIAHAQDAQDMNSDANSIRQDQRDIHHDRQEQREDVENGNFGAAAKEQAEIEARRAHKNDTKEDLNNDLSNRYHRDHNDNGDNN